MKKKVLFIIWSYSYGGGAERVLTNIVNNLDSSKYEIDILEYLYAGIKKEEINDNINLLDPIIDITDRSFVNRVNNCVKEKIVFRFPKLLRKKYIKKNYDVEIAFNYLIPTFLLDYNIKTIGWCHGAITDLKDNDRLRNLQKKYFDKINKIVAISNKTFDSILEVYPEYKDKVKLIYNGFDKNNILMQINDYKSDPIDILYCGRFDENKNPSKFIEIIRNIKKVKKDVKAGMLGIGKLEKDIKKMIDKYELNDNVILYGYKNNPYPIINSTKIMCMTSYSEGFPTVLMEGMILGKPFISTDVAGTKEMSNSNKCGFVSNDNNELCDYALKLLEDKKLYDKMSKDSQIHAANFTLMSQIKNIESLIDGN